jgi:hypothetical protein
VLSIWGVSSSKKGHECSWSLKWLVQRLGSDYDEHSPGGESRSASHLRILTVDCSTLDRSS